MAGNLIETVYSTDSPVKQPAKMLKEMWRDLMSSRELAWRITVRDINSQYRQSILGLAWFFLQPVFSVAAFVFMNAANILNVNSGAVPYPVFVLVGTVFWGLFADSITAPLRMVDSGRALLAKINFPREALLISGIQQTLFNFSVKFLVLVPILLLFKISIPWTILLVPFVSAGFVVMGFALGLILVPMGMLFTDVSRALGVGLGFWMFITPVAYPPLQHGVFGLLTKYNPVAPLIILARDCVLSGKFEYLHSFWIIIGLSIIISFLGWLIYRISMPIIIERMSA